MKLLLLSLLTLIVEPVMAQNTAINNHNYYDYYVGPTSMKGDVVGPINKLKSKHLGYNWLRKDEVAPIVIEEMKKAGYNEVFANRLYRLDSAQYVVLAACSYNSNVGFLYAEGHSAIPSRETRQPRKLLMSNGKYDYVQFAGTVTGGNEDIKIRKLPSNVLILAEDSYWYQYTDNSSDNKYLVTKEDIIRVLRQDIQEKIATAPKPKTR
ncbi:MAG TPA: hypothetical protein VF629_22760 [Hymenobacter sp.]|jgi:hypothetical protein|uniref:hypothetical protein n=1 Tax=Hymenobacter sp. TaxID=1898978 RepID=UPI002EDB74FF